MSRGRAVASVQNMRRDLARMDAALMNNNWELVDSLALVAQAWALSFVVEDALAASTYDLTEASVSEAVAEEDS